MSDSWRTGVMAGLLLAAAGCYSNFELVSCWPDCPSGQSEIESCSLALPSGTTEVRAGPQEAASLPQIVAAAAAGTAILLADGRYEISETLYLTRPGLSLRSASGDRDTVELVAGPGVDTLIAMQADDVSIASLTLRGGTRAIVVEPAGAASIAAPLVYDIVVLDPQQGAIRILPRGEAYADDGVIACSEFRLTEAGRAANTAVSSQSVILGLAAAGWQIVANEFFDFGTPAATWSAVAFRYRSRDTVVERNVISNLSAGILLGGDNGPEAGRRFDDVTCATEATQHLGGLVRNNAIFASAAVVPRFDAGITAWATCGAVLAHNTIFSMTEPEVGALDARYVESGMTITDNLTSAALLLPEAVDVTALGNLQSATAAMFRDAATGDLHLATTATSVIDAGDPSGQALAPNDIDGEARDAHPDVGADELWPRP